MTAATARLITGEPCWEVDNDPWESPHFPDQAQAQRRADTELAQAIADDPGEAFHPARVFQREHPCWARICQDPTCAIEERDEDYPGYPVHYPAATPPTGFWCETHRPPYPWELT